MSTQRAETDTPAQKSRSGVRWGLYLPFGLLLLVVAGWSGFWLVARGVVASGLDRGIADAAARGDAWVCVDRSIEGYPFRIVVRCRDLTLVRSAQAGIVQMSTGPIVLIGQPHTPRHVIVQGDGPMQARLADGRRIEGRWELAEASRRMSGEALERLSLDLRKPVFTLTGPDGAVSTFASAALEAHVRRNPARPASEDAQDIFVRVSQLASGDLDALLGDANASDIDLQATLGQAGLLGRGITPAALEAWRLAGGKLELTRAALKKGIKQIEARGAFAIDGERRISGRIEPSAVNIDQFAGIRLRGGAMDLASALSGRAPPATPDGLKPLPAIDISDGRIGFGPIRLPLPPLQPLY